MGGQPVSRVLLGRTPAVETGPRCYALVGRFHPAGGTTWGAFRTVPAMRFRESAGQRIANDPVRGQQVLMKNCTVNTRLPFLAYPTPTPFQVVFKMLALWPGEFM